MGSSNSIQNDLPRRIGKGCRLSHRSWHCWSVCKNQQAERKNQVKLSYYQSLSIKLVSVSAFSLNQDNVNDRLDAVLSRQCHIESKMSGIGRALTGLSLVSNDSHNLSEMISHTAELSENVSAKVRRLDEARVSLCIYPVEMNESIRCNFNSPGCRNVNNVFTILLTYNCVRKELLRPLKMKISRKVPRISIDFCRWISICYNEPPTMYPVR